MKAKRIIAKRNKEKIKDTFYKLILNSTSGLLDNEHSWLYYNEGAVGLRLTGQLQLLRTIEECMLQDFEVISCNTDGIEVLVLKSKTDEYLSMMKELEKEFNLEWEHEEYIKLYYLNINNYIALTESGKVKRKGEFKIEKSEIPLGDSTDFLIIPKIINKYLIDNPNNKSVEELLMNWKELGFSIYDFCASFKVDKSFSVFHNRVKQQQLNRYYASKHKDSAYLIKVKNSELPNNDEFYTIENINGKEVKAVPINR